MTMLEILQNNGFGPYRKGGSRHVGPCPLCGGSSDTTRFVTKTGSNIGKCFSCGWGGGTIKLIRKLKNLTCKEAHAYLDQQCDNSGCSVYDNCQGTGQRKSNLGATVTVPRQLSDNPTFTPATAISPEHIWLNKATTLVDYAHNLLLQTSKQLQYLAGRGLDLNAVKKYRLGWLAEDMYRARSAWGLPEELKENNQPKKLWIPKGISIPTISTEGNLQRVRIRRPVINHNETRYYWVPGSGNGTTILSPGRRAVIIVESDLDALLLDHLAGDIVTTIALGTSSADPKTDCAVSLEAAAVILVALDTDQAGEKGWQKWADRFPMQAERITVPAGKDPGEAWQKGVNLRQWIIDALPVSLHPRQVKEPTATSVDGIEEKQLQVEPSCAPAPAGAAIVHTITAADGRELHITSDMAAYKQLADQGKIVFTPQEIAFVKQMATDPAEAAIYLDLKQTFPGQMITEVNPVQADDPQQKWRFAR